MMHFKKNASSYAPAAAPFLLLFFAIILFVMALLFKKMETTAGGIITIAVYGFGPLLLLSYLTFHLIARPLSALTGRCFSSLPKNILNLLTGIIYGAAMGTLIVLCVGPTYRDTILIISIFIAIGIINWFSYLKLIEFKA
jgi:hypothetical protein